MSNPLDVPLSPHQIGGLIILGVAGVLLIGLVLAWHVGWIARPPTTPAQRELLARTQAVQAAYAGVRPSHLPPVHPQPQQRTEPGQERVGGKHRRYPDPVPEEETPSAPVKASVPAPTDMTAVDAVFRDTFAGKPDPLAGPTQKVSTVGWPDNPPAPSVPFPVEIDRQNRVLRERLDDPNHTELIPPVPSRRGVA